MFCNCNVHRRGFLRMAGGIAAGLAAWRAPQVMAQSAASASGTAPGARGEFVLRGGHVLSMDARVGDLPSGDVHVRNGVIVAVGPSLNVPGVEVIDARDRIEIGRAHV